MTRCRVCGDLPRPGFLGWHANGTWVRCQWCAAEPEEIEAAIEVAEEVAKVAEPEESAMWEEVYSVKSGDRLERIEAPGGWLYRTIVLTVDGVAVAMTFVPRAPTEYRSR